MRQETDPTKTEFRRNIIRRIRDRAMERAIAGSPFPGQSVGIVPGVGSLTVLCHKEWVERARGLKVRHRFCFILEGKRITEKELYRLSFENQVGVEQHYEQRAG